MMKKYFYRTSHNNELLMFLEQEMCLTLFFSVCTFFSMRNIEFHLPLGIPRSCFPCSTVISAIHKFSLVFPTHRRREWQVAGSVFECQPESTHYPEKKPMDFLFFLVFSPLFSPQFILGNKYVRNERQCYSSGSFT